MGLKKEYKDLNIGRKIDIDTKEYWQSDNVEELYETEYVKEIKKRS